MFTEINFNSLGKIDLQAFSYDPQAQPVNNTSSVDLSAGMTKYYDRLLIKTATPALVHNRFAQKRNIPAKSGDTINFRRYYPFPKALTPLTEGVTPDPDKLVESSIECKVYQYGAFTPVTDVLDMVHVDKNLQEAMTLLGDQAGRTMDTITRNELQSALSIYYAPKVSGGSVTPVSHRYDLDGTAKITVDVVRHVSTMLKARNAPKIDGKYYASYIHPFAVGDLMKDPQWRYPHEYQDTTNIYDGELGMLFGIRFFESSECKIYCGSDLASNNRTLLVNNASGYSGAITSITFDGGTVAAHALKDRYILLNGVQAKVTDNTTTTITVASTNFGTVTDNMVIYPGGGGKEGLAVLSTIFLAANAYGTTSIDGGGLQSIVKQVGSAGAADPLNQRGTAGWKAMHAAKILVDEYIIRVESCSDEFSSSITSEN